MCKRDVIGILSLQNNFDELMAVGIYAQASKLALQHDSALMRKSE
jgi:hypothetical protein